MTNSLMACVGCGTKGDRHMVDCPRLRDPGQYVVRGTRYYADYDYYTRNASVSTEKTLDDALNGVRLCLEAGMQVVVTPWPEMQEASPQDEHGPLTRDTK